MNIEIKKMDQKTAEEIADQWKYSGIYSFYDMTADEEDYSEIVDPIQRRENYYSVIYQGNLIGFFVIEKKEYLKKQAELGLGMKPQLTGQGFGKSFIQSILKYIKNNFDYETIWISVATFNKRAIKVYERVGFEKVKTVKQYSNNAEYNFLLMKFTMAQFEMRNENE